MQRPTFPKEKTHCLAQGLSGKFLHIRRWLRGGFLQRTSMQRTSLHSSGHICPLPPSQPAAFPSELLRPSPNYRGTSGLPVSLIFRNLFLKKKKKKKKKFAHFFVQCHSGRNTGLQY